MAPTNVDVANIAAASSNLGSLNIDASRDRALAVQRALNRSKQRKSVEMPSKLIEGTRLVSEHYRSQGYQLTRAIVPPQKIKGGHLRIQVVEGSIADLEIVG